MTLLNPRPHPAVGPTNPFFLYMCGALGRGWGVGETTWSMETFLFLVGGILGIRGVTPSPGKQPRHWPGLCSSKRSWNSKGNFLNVTQEPNFAKPSCPLLQIPQLLQRGVKFLFCFHLKFLNIHICSISPAEMLGDRACTFALIVATHPVLLSAYLNTHLIPSMKAAALSK